MTKRSVTHATFVIERKLDAPRVLVFKAWADPVMKAKWFAGPDDWESGQYELDFRVGGRERTSGGPPGGPVHSYDALYQDIVPNERIIITYDMHLDETRISVSLVTVEFKPDGKGTMLVFTEQGAYLDGFDEPDLREEGTRGLLDNLAAVLKRESATT